MRLVSPEIELNWISYDFILQDATVASYSSILRRKGGGKAVRVRLIGDELNLRCAGILVIYWSGIL